MNLQVIIKVNKEHLAERVVSYELVFNFYYKSRDGVSLLKIRVFQYLC